MLSKVDWLWMIWTFWYLFSLYYLVLSLFRIIVTYRCHIFHLIHGWRLSSPIRYTVISFMTTVLIIVEKLQYFKYKAMHMFLKTCITFCSIVLCFYFIPFKSETFNVSKWHHIRYILYAMYFYYDIIYLILNWFLLYFYYTFEFV